MGPKLPVERICQPKPCLCTTHEFRCVVHKHGWDWKICSIGSLGPIFCGRTTFLLCKQAPYHFWGLDIKIIDAKLIFVFLAQRQIWSFAFQDDENRLGINFLLIRHRQGACCLFEHIKSRLCAKFRARNHIRSKFSSTAMCVQSICQNGMCFAHTRFWLKNTKYWEFSAHIVLAIVSRCP